MKHVSQEKHQPNSLTNAGQPGETYLTVAPFYVYALPLLFEFLPRIIIAATPSTSAPREPLLRYANSLTSPDGHPSNLRVPYNLDLLLPQLQASFFFIHFLPPTQVY